MVDTFLSDEEKATLGNNQDRLEALAGKFLNADGSIKDKYKDLDEAKYIRDWNKAQTLRSVVAKYEGRTDLTHNEQQEIYQTAQSVGLAENKNTLALSKNLDL